MSLANYGTLTTNAFLGRMLMNNESGVTLTISQTENEPIHIKSTGQIRIGNSGTADEQVLVDKGTLTAATGSITKTAYINTLTDNVATLKAGSLTALNLAQGAIGSFTNAIGGSGSMTGGNAYLVDSGTSQVDTPV